MLRRKNAASAPLGKPRDTSQSLRAILNVLRCRPVTKQLSSGGKCLTALSFILFTPPFQTSTEGRSSLRKQSLVTVLLPDVRPPDIPIQFDRTAMENDSLL